MNTNTNHQTNVILYLEKSIDYLIKRLASTCEGATKRTMTFRHRHLWVGCLGAPDYALGLLGARANHFFQKTFKKNLFGSNSCFFFKNSFYKIFF